ncbi:MULTISPECIES: DUF3263 domain-containing protein [Micromonospora]|uniref:DUF3263 domain-containing protein n=1 Tax=Micromonospora haikouensis TaxID=686309 RepID=A0A1C4VCP8_9ACTN|nr:MULTISPECIES: DUF3263 domain-containing protein [Micromonospora]OON29952.1 hypothetical protein BSA16_18840 [Micromonospora sp. Rc5]SCE81525.1 Protein of unknown function [Micromonospora haikouensis]
MPPADAAPADTDRPEPARPGGREATGTREGVTVPPPRSAPDAATPAPATRAEPVTGEPEPGTPEPEPGAPEPGADPAEPVAAAPGLTERELRILAFEQQWWRHAGAKEQSIRDTFGLSATRYYQLLNGLLDNPAALAAEPVLVGRLRRLRSSRARNRRR